MSRTFKLTTAMTNTTSFSGNFDKRSLSARPQFTGDFRTTLLVGFSAVKSFEGYSFNSITSVMVSASNNTNLLSGSYTLSAYDHYTTLSSISTNMSPSTSLSANYPEVSGFPITTYIINNDNVLTITFPELTATGTLDIIAINPAGYGIFSANEANSAGISVQ